MIGRIRKCGWCGEYNECPRGELCWCANCGHRADVPKLICNCLACVGKKLRAEKTSVRKLGAGR